MKYLQDYCLGLLTEEEEREVIAMCNALPDLCREFSDLRLAIENHDGFDSPPPNPKLRRIIWEAIEKMEKEKP